MERVLPVPLIRPLENHCVPACLAMLSYFYKQSYSQVLFSSLFGGVRVVQQEGVIFSKIVPVLRGLGFVVRPRKAMCLDDVVKSIDKGIPIIAHVAGVNDDLHAVIIKGYALEPRQIIFNNPSSYNVATQEERVLLASFYREWWAKTGQYGVMARPKR